MLFANNQQGGWHHNKYFKILSNIEIFQCSNDNCETVHLAHILTLTLILHMLYLGFVKNGIALLRTSNCLL